MVYPGRPYPDMLPQFVDMAGTRTQTPEMRTRLLEHCSSRYAEGASLRELAAETGRSQTAVRRALAQAGVPLRGRGAPRLEPARGVSHGS